MHRVGSAGNTANSVRPRKEKRLTYVLNDVDNTKHFAGINCLSILKSSSPDDPNRLFSGSRDGNLRRWEVSDDVATCSATFESHVDWVNDAVIVGNDTLVSCSSDTTVKTWSCLGDGTCSKTFRQHSDYVTCLAAAENNSNMFASGGLGGEVFIWDLEAALAPVAKQCDTAESDRSNGVSTSFNTSPITSLYTISSSNNISLHPPQDQGYIPVTAKGHKQSVYAMALNDSGTILVSGGTEKVVRVWDPRSGAKTMKLRGHNDNIRALLIDSSGRFCLSGSSDSMIRLWDLGQQRCIHTYAVHTDSVWALASTPTFSHVYSGGRDHSLYLTDLSTRDTLLLCTRESPISQLALQDDSIWVASTDSSIERWPAEGRSPEKLFQKGGSFLAGNFSFNRARESLEGSTPASIYQEPSIVIHGIPGIVTYEVLNNRRHILTKDTTDSVKLWDITRGIVIGNYGKVSFDEKKEELFEKISIPAWFAVDTKLGGLSIHLDTPQCFTAEMYSADLQISGKSEDDKVNLARETLKGLLTHWLNKRKQKTGSKAIHSGEIPLGKELSTKSLGHSKPDVDGHVDGDFVVYAPFEFSAVSPPSIITEGSSGGPWRKKIINFDGTEDEKDFPSWCLDAILNSRLPSNDATKLSFYLQPCEGSTVKILTQGKLSAPRILKIHKVVNYVSEKMVLNRPLDILDNDVAPFIGGSSHLSPILDGSPRSGSKLWPKLNKPNIEILCNNQVLPPEMSLATVRAYIWKKSEDLVLNYK